MKKLVVLALSLLAGFSTYAGPQGEDNGIGVKLFVGLHGENYGQVDLPSIMDAAREGGPKASPTLGFALDSRWYVAKPKNLGFAINVRWVDMSYASLKVKHSGQVNGKEVTITDKTKYFDMSALGGGLLGTYYFDEKMAVDLYYNILPNVLLMSAESGSTDKSSTSYAFGASHRIGAAYRYKVFQAGFEIKGGKLKYQDWGDDAVESLVGEKFRTGSFRIFLGFKF